MEEFHERVLMYAQVLYERALMRAEREEFKKAEFAASASLSASTFVSDDEDTPDHIRPKATILIKATKSLLSEIWKTQIEGYGQRFLSGKKSREEKFADECETELHSAMKEVKRLRKG